VARGRPAGGSGCCWRCVVKKGKAPAGQKASRVLRRRKSKWGRKNGTH
jgi:hypothetical protein